MQNIVQIHAGRMFIEQKRRVDK